MALVLEQHIVITEGLRGGKPHLAGTRITVSDIVIWHLRQGQAVEEIAAQYDVALSAVYAAMAYYYDHRDEVDREIERSRVFYNRMKERQTSLVEQKLQSSDSD